MFTNSFNVTVRPKIIHICCWIMEIATISKINVERKYAWNTCMSCARKTIQLEITAFFIAWWTWSKTFKLTTKIKIYSRQKNRRKLLWKPHILWNTVHLDAFIAPVSIYIFTTYTFYTKLWSKRCNRILCNVNVLTLRTKYVNGNSDSSRIKRIECTNRS